MDVAWEVVSIRRYKEGYVDVKFYWVYLDGSYLEQRRCKKRITEEKWREFKRIEI